jgi:choline transport protein
LEVCTLYQQQILTMAGTQYDTDLGLVPEDSPKTYKVGTIRDQHDMRRVGKTQELRVGGGRQAFTALILKCSLQRNFRLISILGFTAVLMCTWEAILLYATL